MNYILPNITKTDKELVKNIKETVKAFFNLKGYQPQAYQKAAYLKAGKLYMTNAQMLVEFTLPFETSPEGIFVLPVMVSTEMQLVEQEQYAGFEFPETAPLFEAQHEWLELELEETTLSACYCNVIHAMSTPSKGGILDINLFKLLPVKTYTVKCDAQKQSEVSMICPIVFAADNYRAVIMPMKYN